ncbi:uncharacterized protein LOC113563384 [Ooceraea biroi]|uniref:Myb/SANT-like DNA-binding domain-containing protein n=1 Tax=Ooceraea biroi TaxID=2015173 RepID=A0A026WD96_OOCBI|nr:uncharacterized protein LOC113563384 [Ooceraea biroi]EZA53606.1 hypothetical protein X777_06916 [Ooceraea biroi]
MTKLLIEEIREHISLLNKKNSMQKKIWKEIASNLKKRGYNITDEQYSVKWKNLKQKYKSVRNANNETDSATVSWVYFDLIEELMKTTPEVTPVSLASNIRGFRVHKENVSTREHSESNDGNAVPSTSYGTTRNVRKRTREGNELAYYEKLYKQREMHHKDNIEMQNRFLTVLKEIYKDDQ